MMPRRKLRMPLRLSNTGCVVTYKHYSDGCVWKKWKKLHRQIHYTLLFLCPSAGWSGDLHGEPRAVLQEVLWFHHHYLVIASRSNRGHRGTWEREGKWGVGWRREVMERKASRGWINKVLWWLCMTLPPSFSSFLPVCFSLFQWGAMLCS